MWSSTESRRLCKSRQDPGIGRGLPVFPRIDRLAHDNFENRCHEQSLLFSNYGMPLGAAGFRAALASPPPPAAAPPTQRGNARNGRIVPSFGNSIAVCADHSFGQGIRSRMPDHHPASIGEVQPLIVRSRTTRFVIVQRHRASRRGLRRGASERGEMRRTNPSGSGGWKGRTGDSNSKFGARNSKEQVRNSTGGDGRSRNWTASHRWQETNLGASELGNRDKRTQRLHVAGNT